MSLTFASFSLLIHILYSCVPLWSFPLQIVFLICTVSDESFIDYHEEQGERQVKGSLAQPGVIEENPESWFLWVLLYDSKFWEDSRSRNKQKITLWILRRLGWTVLNYDCLEKWWWHVVTRRTTHKGGDTSAVIMSVIWANLSLWVIPTYFSASWGVNVIRKWSLVIRTNLEQCQTVPLAWKP